MASKLPAPLTEHRSPDQDVVIEEAFIAGTLPEEDRRTHVLVPRETVARIITLTTQAKHETGYALTAVLDQIAHELAALTAQ